MGSVGLGVSWAWNDLLTQDFTLAVPVIDAVPNQDDLAVYTRLVGKAL
jgi:hypothetical protein